MNNNPAVIDAHGRHAQAVAFTRDSQTLLSTGQDAAVRLWSVPGFQPTGAFTGHANSVNSLSFNASQDRLATSSSDGSVRVWSFPDGKCLRSFDKQSGGVFSPAGMLATASKTGKLSLWDLDSDTPSLTVPALDKRTFGLAFSPDGATLLVAGAGPIYRVNVANGKLAGKLEGHSIAVGGLQFSPDGRLLASVGYDGSLRLWSTADWSEVQRIPLDAGGVFMLAFAPDGQRLALSVDKAIRFYSVPDGARLDEISLPLKGIYGLAYSPDGRYLANAAADGRVRVWAV